jgi:pimeloyl-ACP methyl ester carboxylesterase
VAVNRNSPRRRTAWLSIGVALVLATLALLAYGSTPSPAEAGPLASVQADTGIHFSESGDAVVMTPASGATGVGLVFLAGAHIDASAYAYPLSGLVDDGITVVIARPVLSFAILEFRPLRTFTGLAPGISTWYVGGHSLGGVRACQYAKDDYSVAGLVLLGSYCAADLSHSSIPVLSIGGSRDGLSTPASIRTAAHLLPDTTTFVEIAGADHASFGSYGPQAGDNPATTAPSSVRSQLTTDILEFARGGG